MFRILACLIRKTLERRKRIKGHVTLKCSPDVNTLDVKKCRLLGGSTVDFRGKLVSVGSEEEDDYGRLDLRYTDDSIITVYDFINAVNERYPGFFVENEEKTGVIVNPPPGKITPSILSERHLRFEDRTTYSIFMHVSFEGVTASKSLSTPFIFYDTGGSGSVMSGRVSADGHGNFYKTVGGMYSTLGRIATTNYTGPKMTLYYDKFAILFGSFYSSQFKEYNGAIGSVRLKYPLRGVGNCCDEYDFASGKGMRRIRREVIDNPGDFDLVEDGIFYYPLSTIGVAEEGVLCNRLSSAKEDTLTQKEGQIALNEYGDGLLLYLGAGKTEEDLREFLEEELVVCFVRETPKEFTDTATFPFDSQHKNVSLLSDARPYLFYVEYKEDLN